MRLLPAPTKKGREWATRGSYPGDYTEHLIDTGVYHGDGVAVRGA